MLKSVTLLLINVHLQGIAEGSTIMQRKQVEAK